MPTPNRKRRGMRTQQVVALYLRERGWPYAESTGSGRLGVDITGCPDLAIEVKARADLSPVAWMRQAERGDRAHAGHRLPLVIYRANGMGEDAGRYLAMVRLSDLVDLLAAAGYGDGQSRNLGVSESRHLGISASLDQGVST